MIIIISTKRKDITRVVPHKVTRAKKIFLLPSPTNHHQHQKQKKKEKRKVHPNPPPRLAPIQKSEKNVLLRTRHFEDGTRRKAFAMSSCSAHHHHHHHQASFVSTQFRGRVGKTSLKNKASCSTSTSSSSSNNSGRAGVRCFAAISKPWDVQKPCKLVLEDGSVWQGKAFGAEGTKIGEVVFNTSLSG